MAERTPERAFLDDVVEFRRLMGTKTFWDKPTKVDAAKRGLAIHYTSVSPPDEAVRELVTTAFVSTMSEFSKRAFLLGFDV